MQNPGGWEGLPAIPGPTQAIIKRPGSEADSTGERNALSFDKKMECEQSVTGFGSSTQQHTGLSSGISIHAYAQMRKFSLAYAR